ncbi:MAG: hypothetical protein ACTSQF_00230 [Candidatus Heimdallarchaeaceae archaeon]
MARKDRINKGDKSLGTYLDSMSAEEKRQMYMDMYGSWENVPESKRTEVERMEGREDDIETYGALKMESKPAGKIVPTKGTIPEKGIKEIYDTGDTLEDTGEFGQTTGSMISSIGQSAATTIDFISNVVDGPDKETNYFADYANRTLAKINEIKTFAGVTRKMKLADTTMAERGARAANRGTARGIGSLRALDLGVHIAGMKERRAIEGEFATDVTKTLGMEADTLLNQDSVRMGAETDRAEKEQMNRDTWKTNFSQSLMNIGSTAQNIGRNMNTEKSEEIGWGIAKSSSKFASEEEIEEFYKWKYSKPQ